MKLDRRLNILIYLNKNWNDNYGGNLQLWNKEMTKCEKKISPEFNKMVIFSTTDFSYHGNPDKINCPKDNSRKSIAMYYYSNGRPSSERKLGLHSTIFRKRPGSNDPDGKLDGQLNYYHVISGKTKDDGDIKAAAMFKESLKTNGSKLLEEGIRWFGLNPITGTSINRFIMVRGFTNSKVVDKYLVPWSDPAEPTHSTYTRIWQDQFANDWAGVLFRTIRQIIH